MSLEPGSGRGNNLKTDEVLEMAKNAILANHLPSLAAASKELALLAQKQPDISDERTYLDYIKTYFFVASFLAESPRYLPQAIASFRNIARHAPAPEHRQQAAIKIILYGDKLRKPGDRVAAFVDAACFARPDSAEEKKAVAGFIKGAEELNISDRLAAYRYAAHNAPVDSLLERKSVTSFVMLANKHLDADELIANVAKFMMGRGKEEPAIPDFMAALKNPHLGCCRSDSLEM